jgi:uncharacterized protein
MNDQKIISPCISICKTDYSTGYCYGCARTEEEKKIWKDEETNSKWKKENFTELLGRMTGWQLDSFKESYEHKVKTGISIFKKNQIKK